MSLLLDSSENLNVLEITGYVSFFYSIRKVVLLLARKAEQSHALPDTISQKSISYEFLPIDLILIRETMAMALSFCHEILLIY